MVHVDPFRSAALHKRELNTQPNKLILRKRHAKKNIFHAENDEIPTILNQKQTDFEKTACKKSILHEKKDEIPTILGQGARPVIHKILYK